QRNKLTMEDIDLFVFHQASKMALNSLARLLRVDTEKMYCNLGNIGNTVSASIPIALKDAWNEGRISEGSTILVAGFGVGLSWGTAIIRM
ncbi:MAG: 3-oxoacyl-[acyl-carrier-protein] synthase III C-terminal domain-containing protein, partial [Pseudomonadota bacterium]